MPAANHHASDVSFFDDDQPTRAARPARPRRAGGGGGGARAAGAPDPDTARRRQLVGGAVLVVGLVLLVFLVNGCLDARRENALKTYNREVAGLADGSGRVSAQLFEALNGGASGEDLQVAVNQLRQTAEDEVGRAQDLDVPGGMEPAQRNLELVLNLRAGALAAMADVLPSTASQEPQTAEDAVRRVAGEMRTLLASDVVYAKRVQPLIAQTLEDDGVGGQTIEPSRFLPTVAWLDPDTVAGRLGADAAAPGSSNAQAGQPAPGLHGHGLQSVTVGDLTLQPGGQINRIPAGADLAFDVTFQNQGENDEQDVTVTVSVQPRTGKAIVRRKRVQLTRAGEEASTSVGLGSAPPVGAPATVKVAVEKVPGEENTDNNTQSYVALFTR
jgi:hypothetical protein